MLKYFLDESLWHVTCNYDDGLMTIKEAAVQQKNVTSILFEKKFYMPWNSGGGGGVLGLVATKFNQDFFLPRSDLDS